MLGELPAEGPGLLVCPLVPGLLGAVGAVGGSEQRRRDQIQFPRDPKATRRESRAWAERRGWEQEPGRPLRRREQPPEAPAPASSVKSQDDRGDQPALPSTQPRSPAHRPEPAAGACASFWKPEEEAWPVFPEALEVTHPQSICRSGGPFLGGLSLSGEVLLMSSPAAPRCTQHRARSGHSCPG